MATPAIQTLMTDAQEVLNLKTVSEIHATLTAALANANIGTPLNPNLTTQQLWNEFYEIVRQTPTDIESILVNQMMKFLYSPPAPGGVGADKQVIFNDGGVLAGDADLTFNKALNKLVANNIETTANLLVGTSATITGDLTVRTNRLATTTTGVGIGTASPILPLDVRGGAGAGALFLRTTDPTAAVSSAYIQTPVSTGFSALVPIYGFWYQNCGMGNPASDAVTLITASTERYRIDSAGTNTWSNVGGAGTAMTLNATGLGVGTSPLYNIHARGTTNGRIQVEGASGFGMVFIQGSSGNTAQLQLNSSGGTGRRFNLYSDPTGFFGISDETAVVTRLTIDASGNVGIGVASPATKVHIEGASATTASTLQIVGAATSTLLLGQNADGGVIRGQGGSNCLTFWTGGSASTAASGTGTERMRLDASGNLLVGTTAAAGSASNSTKTVGGIFSSVNGTSASTASGSAVTLFASQSEATYMVSAYVLGTGAPATYNAVAIVKTNAGVATLTTISSATNLTISISGLNVQVTQTSGVSQVITYNVIRIS